MQSQRLAKCWPYFLKYSDFQLCLPFYHNLSLPMKFSPDARAMISWASSRWTLPVGQINWLPQATSNTLRYSFIIVYADDFSSGASVSEYHHKVTFSLRSSSEIESSDNNGIYTSRIEAVTRTEVVHYLFPIYDLINLLWFWFRFYCNCINALHQALKGSEIVLFILIEREI